MNTITPIFIPYEEEKPEKIKCPKCQHEFELAEEEISLLDGVMTILFLVFILWIFATIVVFFIDYENRSFFELLQSQVKFIASKRLF